MSKIKPNIKPSQNLFRFLFGIVLYLSSIFIENLVIEFILVSVYSLMYLVFTQKMEIESKKFNLEIIFYFISFVVLNLIFSSKYKWIVDSAFLAIGFTSGIIYFLSFRFKLRTFRLFTKFKIKSEYLIFSIFLWLILLVNNIGSGALGKITIYELIMFFEIAILITTITFLTSKYIESFVLPFLLSVCIYIFFNNNNSLFIFNFSLGLSLALVISIFSASFKLLTIKGCVAQFIIGTFIFGFGGLKWAIPILAFFILSSLLSKFRKKLNKDVDAYFEKSDVRDQFQVLANGGFGTLLVLLNQVYHSELLYFIYVSSLAAVCADTWATEIGTMWKTKTINILNFKKVEQGSSGGVSFYGIIGAILGAFIIPISSLSWISKNFINFVLVVTISGVLGSIIDSLLGATLQTQFKCRICGKITEKRMHCNQKGAQYKGLEWVNNDLVNFITSLSGGIIFIPIKSLFKV